MSADATDLYLTAAELAERHRKSEGTIANERAEGLGVPYIKIGGAVRYSMHDVLAYENAGGRGYTRDTVAAAIASFPGIAAEQATKLRKHIHRSIKVGI